MTKNYKNPVCKGSYILGTACGKCERCKDELKKYSVTIPTLTDPDINMPSVEDVINSLGACGFDYNEAIAIGTEVYQPIREVLKQIAIRGY